MNPARRLIDVLREAKGRRVVVIGEDLPNTHVDVIGGTIFFRNYIEQFLKTLRVDTVWFMEYPPPPKVEELGRQMTCLSKAPRILKGNE
jgi:hypothetical protein